MPVSATSPLHVLHLFVGVTNTRFATRDPPYSDCQSAFGENSCIAIPTVAHHFRALRNGRRTPLDTPSPSCSRPPPSRCGSSLDRCLASATPGNWSSTQGPPSS